MFLWIPYNEASTEIDVDAHEIQEEKPDEELFEGWEWRKFKLEEVE